MKLTRTEPQLEEDRYIVKISSYLYGPSRERGFHMGGSSNTKLIRDPVGVFSNGWLITGRINPQWSIVCLSDPCLL